MIAPEHVSAVSPAGTERQHRTAADDGQRPSPPPPPPRRGTQPLSDSLPDLLPPLPPPPDPPGTAYVAAVIAGQLSPRPTSMEEVFLRVGKDWSPPDSQFRLTDKSV